MARYLRDQGYCDYCSRRVWVGCRNAFFTRWRCETCGTAVEVVGPRAVQAVEVMQREARAQDRALSDPTRQVAGAPCTALPDPGGRTYGGLIGWLCGWLVRN